MPRRAPSPPPRPRTACGGPQRVKGRLGPAVPCVCNNLCGSLGRLPECCLASSSSSLLSPPPPPRLLHEVGSLSCCRGSQLLHIWLLLPIYMLESGEGASAVPQTSFLLQWWRHPGPVSLQGEGKKPNKQKADPSPVIS